MLLRQIVKGSLFTFVRSRMNTLPSTWVQCRIGFEGKHILYGGALHNSIKYTIGARMVYVYRCNRPKYETSK